MRKITCHIIHGGRCFSSPNSITDERDTKGCCCFPSQGFFTYGICVSHTLQPYIANQALVSFI
ncbi:hypothetical protein K492DRAFT_69465 [Lichtheimia hyalospora FSU 10163]|nr:hypothetical protein K492DRAFT_69465 [Lichtheimia hyalospora FSU 10163]